MLDLLRVASEAATEVSKRTAVNCLDPSLPNRNAGVNSNMSSQQTTARLVAIVGIAVLGAAGLYVWKGRTPKSTAPSQQGAQDEGTGFSSSAARTKAFAEVTADPVLIGRWQNSQTVGGAAVDTNLVLRADGTFEQVITLTKGRIIRAGHYAAAGGVLRFASVTCQTDDPAKNDMLCSSPMYDSSYALEGGALSVIVHRAKGDTPPILFTRGSGS